MADTDVSCLICCEVTPYKVLGKCNHPICLACSAKLRDLCEENYCTVCREILDKVIGVFRYTRGEYAALILKCKIHGSKPGITFEDKAILTAYKDLFAYKCRVCRTKCNSDRHLQEHLKQRHSMFFCEICKDNLKVFVKDLAVYNKADLRVHRVRGEENDTSMKGHPLCEFCQDRYLDNETLHIHLRKKHFWCHLCEGQAFYCAYADLKIHYKKCHYLCERGDCINEQMTNVFKTEIDLQAHITTRHKSELGKGQQRQMRRVDVAVNFTFASSRPSSSRQRVRGELPREQMTDAGNWYEPNSSLRPNTASVKPMLGNKAKLPYRPDNMPGSATATSRPPADKELPMSLTPPPSRRHSPPSRRHSPPAAVSSYRRHSPQPPRRQSPPPPRRQSPPRRTKTKPEPPKPEPKPAEPKPAKASKSEPKITKKVNKDFPSLRESNNPGTKEVGRPPPPKIREPTNEPTVGRPPEDFYSLEDDDEYRKRNKKKKQNVSPLVGVGRGKQNSAWVNGRPNVGRSNPSRGGHNSRKQPKSQHSQNFDESDFQWLSEDQPRDRSRSNERSRGNKRSKETGQKHSDNKPSSARSKKETPRKDEQKEDEEKEGEAEDEEPVSPGPPDNCCVPNNPWNDDDDDDSTTKYTKPKKGHPKPKKGDLMRELCDIGKQLSLDGTDDPATDCNPNIPTEPPTHRDNTPDYNRVRETTQSQRDYHPEQARVHLPPEPSPVTVSVTNGTFSDVPPTLQMIFNSARAPPSPQDNEYQIPPGLPEPRELKPVLANTLHNFPPLSGEGGSPTLHLKSYAPPTTPGNITNREEYPPLDTSTPPRTVSPPSLTTRSNRPINIKDTKSFPALGAEDHKPPSLNPDTPAFAPRSPPTPAGYTRTTDTPPSYTRSTDTPPGFTPQKPAPPGLQHANNPPPGVGAKFTRPPGFSRPVTTAERPPGFASQQGAENVPPSLSDILLNSNNSNYLQNSIPCKPQVEYIEGANFTKRNKEYAEQLTKHMGPIVFTEYQKAYNMLKNKSIDVCFFIRICRKCIDRDQFDSLFEEFVVLQRDIALQNQLYIFLGKPPSLIPCSICNQIVKQGDLLEHSEQHSISESTDLRTHFSHLLRK